MIFSSPRSVLSSTTGSRSSPPASEGSPPSGRRAPSAASSPRGSNVGTGSGMDRLLPALDPVDQPVDATFGGELAALLEPLVPARVARNQHQGKVEAAGAHDRHQVVDRGGDASLLPAGDHRAVAPGALGQLALGQAGPQPRLPD